MHFDEIDKLKNCFLKELLPEQVYLFGSFAQNVQTEGSDLDFYIVLPDGVSDLAKETMRAYRSIRHIKQRPIDILLGTKSRFEERKQLPSVEQEVFQKGVLLYDARSKGMV